MPQSGKTSPPRGFYIDKPKSKNDKENFIMNQQNQAAASSATPQTKHT